MPAERYSLMRQWRKATWVLVLFTAIMFAWIGVYSLATRTGTPSCETEACRFSAAGYGNSAAWDHAATVASLFALWLIGTIVLLIIWAITKRLTRDRATM